MSTLLEKRKSKIFNFHGPIAAPVTQFDSNGNLDTSKVFEYLQHLVKIGTKGLYLSGTTGEGLSLSIDEKFQLIDAWRKALDRLPAEDQPLTIVHASSTVVGDIVKYIKRAEELNFDCVALLPPLYYRPTTKELMVDYYKQILNLAAPDMPFLYYNNYTTSPLNFEMEDFIELALDKIPQLCAIKWSHYNLHQFSNLQIRFGTRIKICPGMNEILLSTVVFGCDAPILSTLSIPEFANWFKSLDQAVKRGDLVQARRDQEAITLETIKLRKVGYLTGIKAELNRQLNSLGIYFGVPRSPVYIKL